MKTILETPRLILREMTQEDYPALAAILRDEQTMYAYEGAFSESETQAWLDKNLARYRDDGIGLWAVILKESGSMIGQAGLTWQDVNGRRVPEVGYLFNRAYWGNGYATEAAIACKEYGFSQLGFDEIYSIVRDTNIASINVAIRNDMVIRKRFIKHYRGVDMPHYAFAARNELQNKLEEMSEFFNTRAERYDTVHIEHIGGGAESKKILAGFLPEQAKRLLDIGIGTGLELEEIFKCFPDILVTGYDIAEDMLRRLVSKYPDKCGQLDLRLESYLAAEFDLDYDAVMSVMTLHHYDHAAKTAIYRKILNSLCDGGIYVEADYMLSESVFADPEAEERRLFTEYARLRKDQELDSGAEYHFDTPCTVENNKKMLADAGFTDVREVWSVKNTTVLTARKPNSSFRIEKATHDEIYEIAAFLDACWQAAYRDIIAPDFLAAMSVSVRHEKLLMRFDNGISEFLVMRDGDKIIGAAVFGKLFTEGYPDNGEISAIYLHNDYIGKGYGHALFAEIERILADMGYAHFVLDVLSENKRAVEFYLEHGYERVAENYIRLGEKEYPLTVFRKANTIIMGEEKEMRP